MRVIIIDILKRLASEILAAFCQAAGREAQLKRANKRAGQRAHTGHTQETIGKENGRQPYGLTYFNEVNFMN